MKLTKEKIGLTLVEFVIVMAVIALILSIAIPNFRNMQQEGALTKAEGDLDTLKVAVTTYWRNNSQAFPSNIHIALTDSKPATMTKVLNDPWNSDANNNTYGYITGSDKDFGDYYILFTKGPRGDTTPAWDAENQRVTYTGSGRVVSNAPIVKEQN